MKIFYFWAWKAVNILFPFAVVLGRIFDIPRSKIEQSFIEVSNHLVKQHRVKVPASLSAFTRTRKLEASPLNSPEDANTFNFCVASTAFDTISRRKIS